MKKIIIFSLIVLFSMQSCLDLENEPLVTVDPSVSFQGHIRNNQVYVTGIVDANPVFIDPGNIPTVLSYNGELELYNNVTGELLNSSKIDGAGLSSIAEVSTSADNFDKIVIIASGTVTIHGDKESDGDSSNDVFIHSSDFYEVINLTEVVNLQDYPVVTVEPSVSFQSYISSQKLHTTASIMANPTYIVTGANPIVFDYKGVMQLYDEVSGNLLKSSSLSGDGLSNAVTIAADTASFDGFVIIASGTIFCYADIESDGDLSNDLLISEAEFSEIIMIDLIEE